MSDGQTDRPVVLVAVAVQQVSLSPTVPHTVSVSVCGPHAADGVCHVVISSLSSSSSRPSKLSTSSSTCSTSAPDNDLQHYDVREMSTQCLRRNSIQT